MVVLFLNHNIIHCGVYQYGKRIYDILKKDNAVKYIYHEVTTAEDYRNLLETLTNITHIIYNYHLSTMPWLNGDIINKKYVNIGIPHESVNHIFDIICEINPIAESKNNIFPLPRPIFENIDYNMIKTVCSAKNIDFITSYTDTDIPIFGSFGFGFYNKGFDKIVKLVNEQYDNAIIKLIITMPHYSGQDKIENIKIGHICDSIKLKDGIKLFITYDFFSEEEILYFLHKNTMNIFLYDKMDGRSISSTIDYALSVKRPIGISDSSMFRHIYDDKICLYNTSITDCLSFSEEYCSKYLEKYSNNNMINTFRHILNMG